MSFFLKYNTNNSVGLFTLICVRVGNYTTGLYRTGLFSLHWAVYIQSQAKGIKGVFEDIS